MSVRADVKILILKENFYELNDKIMNQGFEDYELTLWQNKKLEVVTKADKQFIILSWYYVKWDECTNELVETILNYLRMLRNNSAPCKYIAIYDVGTDEEITSYGDDPEIIGYIAGAMYIEREIKISDDFYEIEE